MKEKNTKTESKFIKFARVAFYAVMKPFVWIYSVVFQGVRFSKNGYKIPKGSALFLSNHVTNWDGLYLNCMFFTRIIRFIVNEEMFENKFVAWFSKNLLGEVCRGVKSNDVSDILEMKRIVKKKASLGLYPEGDIDFFGRNLPIEISIAKFAKMLGIPVVLTRIQGAHIRAPRWADRARHAHIRYSVTDVISAQEVKSLPAQALYERILKGIENDDLAYQSETRYRQFPAPKRAEWLELGLFYCPNCHSYETLFSKGDQLFCRSCDFWAKYDRYCMMQSKDGNEPALLTAWDDRQRKALKDRLKNRNGKEPIFIAKDLELYVATPKGVYQRKLEKTDVTIYQDRLTYICNETEVVIPIQEMQKISVRHKDLLEIYYGDGRLCFGTKKRKWSAYLYVLTLLELKNYQPNKGERL